MVLAQAYHRHTGADWSDASGDQLIARLGGDQWGKVLGSSLVQYFTKELAGMNAIQFSQLIRKFKQSARAIGKSNPQPC